MAFICRSGVELPLAISTSTSRAFGELLCASTNSARSFSFGELVPCRNFCSIGIASSGSAFCSAVERQQLHFLVALVLRVAPAARNDARTSTSSAFASSR